MNSSWHCYRIDWSQWKISDQMDSSRNGQRSQSTQQFRFKLILLGARSIFINNLWNHLLLIKVKVIISEKKENHCLFWKIPVESLRKTTYTHLKWDGGMKASGRRFRIVTLVVDVITPNGYWQQNQNQTWMKLKTTWLAHITSEVTFFSSMGLSFLIW